MGDMTLAALDQISTEQYTRPRQYTLVDNSRAILLVLLPTVPRQPRPIRPPRPPVLPQAQLLPPPRRERHRGSESLQSSALSICSEVL